MSKYRLIKCEFRNPDSLIKALNDLGIPFDISTSPRTPTLPLFGYHDDEREERASIAIRRQWLNKNWSSHETHDGASNDIGFAWNGSQFVAIVSEYDSSREGVTAAMNKLRQRYSLHEAMRLAHSKGYLVRETASQDGKIRIVLQKR